MSIDLSDEALANVPILTKFRAMTAQAGRPSIDVIETYRDRGLLPSHL